MKCYICGATVKGMCYCIGDQDYWLCDEHWREVKMYISMAKAAALEGDSDTRKE